MLFRGRFFVLLVLVALAHAGAASGQSYTAQEAPLDRSICEPPISTCGFGLTLSDSLTSSHPVSRDDCPLGYSCACVPSCEECDDCDAQVCLPDPTRECNTACDCEPGLACLDGRCIVGFAPVFCCDADICPADQQCQRRTGEWERCERDPGDPMCGKRVEQASRAIRKIIHKNKNLRCRVDSDCVWINAGTECGSSCGAVVNRSRANRVKRKIEQVDRKFCSDFEEKGCDFEAVACLPVILMPSCVENRCAGSLDGDFFPTVDLQP